jgi:hypothetical protein
MAAETPRETPLHIRGELETHTDRMLRIAEAAKAAKSEGLNITHMSREKRREVLFG